MKKRILTGITYAEFIIAMLAICAMDSQSLIVPIVALLQAFVWIGLFTKANPWWAS